MGSGRGARFCLKGRSAFGGGGESRRLPRSAKPSAERRAGVRMAAFIGVGDIAGIEKAAAVADEGETSRFAEQSGGEVPSGGERLGREGKVAVGGYIFVAGRGKRSPPPLVASAKRLGRMLALACAARCETAFAVSHLSAAFAAFAEMCFAHFHRRALCVI